MLDRKEGMVCVHDYLCVDVCYSTAICQAFSFVVNRYGEKQRRKRQRAGILGGHEVLLVYEFI
jgi:hypothetical protein